MSVHPLAYRQPIINSRALPYVPATGNGSASCSQIWPAAPRGWKPILNNRAFIFNELLHNGFWAGDLARPALLFYAAAVITWAPAIPSSLSPLWDQNTKGIPICFVDSEPKTGISSTHLALCALYLLMMLKLKVLCILSNRQHLVWAIWPCGCVTGLTVIIGQKQRHINVQACLGWAFFFCKISDVQIFPNTGGRV